MNVLHVALLVAVGALAVTRYGKGGPWLPPIERFFDGRVIAWMIGCATALGVWWVWGSLGQLSWLSDEASYLLQAKLFAAGRWSAPPPPLPAFFEQAHVLLDPSYASKYPPGHALLLAPGVLLGLPGLVPVLLSGITGALMFILARQVSNAWVAILAWLIWFSTRGNLMFRPSYLSEVTTGALWLAAWWAALRWHKSGHPMWLVALAACVGWGAITRPLTMLAFALPLSGFVLWKVSRSRRWTELAVPFATVLAILAIVPLWSAKVSGDWRHTPLGAYTQAYMPWDKPGFGLEETPATRSVPPDMSRVFDEFVVLHREHTKANLPEIAWERVLELGRQLWGGWRNWLLPATLIGLFALNAAGWIAVASVIALFLAYLSYAHPPIWTVYYLETFPLLAFLCALGLWKTLVVFTGMLRGMSGADTPTTSRATVTMLLLVPLLGYFSVADRSAGARWHRARLSHHRRFVDHVARIPEARAMVFVRYSPDHFIHDSHVANDAELGNARFWFVHDRGVENTALMQAAPDRVPYLYDESKRTLQRMR